MDDTRIIPDHWLTGLQVYRSKEVGTKPHTHGLHADIQNFMKNKIYEYTNIE